MKKKNARQNDNIPNIISDMLILLYALNKDIRNKKLKGPLPFYLINANFLNQIKNLYNYNKICKELDKINYTNIENKIEEVKAKINIKSIINKEIIIKAVTIRPEIKNLYSTDHLVNFSIVNKKILDIITKIKTHFNLTAEMRKKPFDFYFSPETFYICKGFHNKNYMKIITLKKLH